ncbi:MAG: Mur ligase family protein, partial [Rhodospirillaceae bacterium]
MLDEPMLNRTDSQGLSPAEALPTVIDGLTADSRAVQPGYLFAALPGVKADGRAFVGDALNKGAGAILMPEGTDLAAEVIAQARRQDTVLLTSREPRRALARMAAAFYGRQPDTVAAVTGTNGKTSVAVFTAALWASAGHGAASLGTLGIHGQGPAASVYRDGNMTTPDPVTLHGLLKDVADAGVTHLAMEASSHGLSQYRLDGVTICAAAFTNLTQDHLDYHGTMEAYLAAKARLFSEVLMSGGTAVLNADDATLSTLAPLAERRGARLLRYGRKGAELTLVDSTLTA